MPSTATLQLAIIGSGPSGCYLAQSILRARPETEITIFDRLPSPYGLIRYGVAADHQHTKAITRQFERLFADPRVRFAGNIDVGRDLDTAQLRDAFDAVVLASGLAGDRPLEVPGGSLAGVYGAGALTRILNSHPGERPEFPDLGTDVVIIGGGNVAIDLLRFLVKDRAGYLASDIADHALDRYLAQPAERVTLLNRSRAAEAKSDPQMIRELAALERAHYDAPELGDTAPIEGDRAASARLAAFAELTSAERTGGPGPKVTIRFGAAPLRILDERAAGAVSAVECSIGDSVESIPATAVITAIGFTPADDLLTGLLAAHGAPEHATTGRIAPGLYRTGWAKRGPRGAIPENRSCAKEVADEIAADLDSGALVARGVAGFAALPAKVQDQAVTYDEWLHIDQRERDLASPDRVRRKLTDSRAMIDIARTSPSTERNPHQ